MSDNIHDAYVTIGCDELNYVGCDTCGTIFGPTDNEFEANGVANDHAALGVTSPLNGPAGSAEVITPNAEGATVLVGHFGHTKST